MSLVKAACVAILFAGLACHAGTLKLAMDNFPPFQFVENGLVRGVNVDIVTTLAAELGLQVEIIQCPWARCLRLIEDGHADMLAGLVKTPERQQHMVFIEPPYHVETRTGVVAYQLKSKPLITTTQDLYGKIIAIQRGVEYGQIFAAHPAIKTVEIAEQNAIVRMLLKGNIDAFLYSGNGAAMLLNNVDLKDQIIPSGLKIEDIRKSHLVVSKHSDLLSRKTEINQALDKLIASGAISTIYQRYGLSHQALAPEL